MREAGTYIASAAISIFLTGLIILAHDISDSFKQSLAGLTGHHWLSVSMVALVLFALSSGFLLASKNMRKNLRTDNIGLWSSTMTAITLIMILGISALLISYFLAD
jgi:ABC-type proline/glycine betaine transport system permease subunit